MFKNILRPDSPLMITMTNLTDCIFLSLFWLLGCVPVVTVGASFAALYDASFHALRRGERDGWSRFLRSWKANWKSGIVPTLLFLGTVLLGGQGLIALWNAAVYGQISFAVFSGAAFLGILVVGIFSVVFAVLSRFENSTGALVKNSVFLAMANLPRTIALGMLHSISGVICMVYILPVFFLPSLAAFLGSLLIEPMFKPYLE